MHNLPRMRYTADLCGTISQSLKALNGYDIMALELIQNADDAGATHLSFDIRDSAMVVRNSAEFSNCGRYGEICNWVETGGPLGSHKPCNIHAISTMGARSKFEAGNQIGRFGIGFVSVFQVTDSPIIRSGDCEMVLNPLEPQIEPTTIPKRDDTEFELPWATSETPVRKALDVSPVPAEIKNIVLSETLKTIRSSMLFLRHLDTVEIFCSGILTERLHIERKLNQVTMTFDVSGETTRWLLMRSSAEKIIRERKLFENFSQLKDHNRSEEVTLAFAIDQGPIDGKLFAYLPTEQSSRLPLHINGDFYPESSRKNIVLRGLGQERHWNEALIVAAAGLIETEFDELKQQLGPVGLWNLGASCFDQRNDEIFKYYWTAFQNAARRTTSVLSATGEWLQPKDAAFRKGEFDQNDYAMFSKLGLPLVSHKIQGYWNSLEAAGVRQLSSEMCVNEIKKRGPAQDDELRPYLLNIWQLAGSIVREKNSPNYAKLVQKLSSACFLQDTKGDPTAPKDIWRMPDGLQAEVIHDFLPDCPIVSPEAFSISGISDLLDEYHLEAFAADLGIAIETEDQAAEIIGTVENGAKKLYEILLRFRLPADHSNVVELLKSVPMLRTRVGYVAPKRAQLPGGFDDPTGYLEFVDTEQFPLGMEKFAAKILAVPVLSFGDYLTNYIPKITEENRLSPESFRSIAEQISQHRRELAADGVMSKLSEVAFIPTRAEAFAKARECYKWSPSNERVLGPERHNWLEENWLPQGRAGSQFRDILETDLGMPSRPTLSHILRRIKEIATTGSISDETVKSLDILVDQICDYLPYMNEDDKRSVAALKSVNFLPALRRGDRDESGFLRPKDIYRATRAAGFESQVPIIELNTLRRPRRQHIEFMHLIEMPQVPPVEQVVSHLRFCVESETKVSTVTYELLNEAVSDKRGLEKIEELADEPYIFDPVTERYLMATEVFWAAPDAGRYWKNASPAMRRQEVLHEFLGVRSKPGPKDFARLMVEICRDPEPESNFRQLHESCVVQICRALEDDDSDLTEAFEILDDELSLIDLNGDAAFSSDVLWIDRHYLAEPFGHDLDDKLISPPQVDRASLSRFYNRMGVDPLSSLAAQKLAQEPDHRLDTGATSLLEERYGLLLWLAPNEVARSELCSVLANLSVSLTSELKVQIELNFGGTPVVSPPANVQAFLESGTMHIRGTAMNQSAWISAFRQIFLSIEHLCPLTDIKPLAITAAMVITSDNRAEAESALVEGGFAPPLASGWKSSKATELVDIDADADALDHSEEPTDEELIVAHKEPQKDGSMKVEPQAEAEKANARTSEAQQSGEVNVRFDNDQNTDRPTEARSTKVGEFGSQLRKSSERGEQPGIPKTNSSGQIMPDIDDYKSKAGGNFVGTGSDEHSAADAGSGTERTGSETPKSRTSKPKTSRMLAYVARTGDRSDDGRAEHSDEENKKIDARSIERVMRYEADQGRSPDEQDHFNPGFDIISTEPDGRRRLIEVKGLRGPWNERGTKLSRTQFSMAQTNADEYWLYIVEAALDPNAQQLYAIRNPFQQVDEYWFDSAWKTVAERLANTVQLNARVGAKVHHEQWGRGQILEIKKTGLQTGATVDFGFQGKKFITVNNSLKFVD